MPVIHDKGSDLFRIEVQNHSPKELQQNSVTSDRLVLNIGRPNSVEIRKRGHWQRKIYNSEDFSVVPYGQENIVRWFEDIRFIVVQIGPGFIQQYLQIKDLSLAEYRGISDKTVYDLATEMCRATEQPPAKIYLQSLAISLSIHLGTQYQASGTSIYAPRGKLSSLQLQRVLEYCNASLHEDFGVDDLAAQVHLSAFHFSRLFKNTLSLAPHQFVLQLKIERAQQLIKRKTGSLSQIAYQLGFTDPAHFSNTFKKVTGLSPTQYLGHN
jgi:AraC family transcriptional regulator